MLTAVVANDVAYQAPIQLTNPHIVQPIGALLNEFPQQAANIFAQTLHQGDTVLVLWNKQSSSWGAFSPGAGGPGGPDEKVKATAFDLAAGYLSDKAVGVSPWIATSVAGGAGTLQTVNISHIGPAAAYTTIDPVVEFDITSDTGGQILRLRTHSLAFDQKGHNTSGGGYTNRDIPLGAFRRRDGPDGSAGTSRFSRCHRSPGRNRPTRCIGAASASGPQGATGPQGPQGPQGNDGPRGAAGPQGNDGVPGATGSQGPTGPQAPRGPRARRGLRAPLGHGVMTVRKVRQVPRVRPVHRARLGPRGHGASRHHWSTGQ